MTMYDHIKTDRNSIDLFCNTLNAQAGILRYTNPRLANVLLRAQGTINKLCEEKQERKKGKWIFVHPLQKDDPGAYLCSVCEYGDWDIKPTDKYCKFCGADMRGEET